MKSVKKAKKKYKGFTLIELLAVIVILSVVAGLGGYVITNVIESTKRKSEEVTINNIQKAAEAYASEFKTDKEWYGEYVGTGENFREVSDFSCTTVQMLIDKGFLKNDIVLPKDFTRNSMIVIRRNEYKSIVSSSIQDVTQCIEYDDKDAEFTFDSNRPDGLNGWYKKNNILGEIDVIVGRSGIKSIEYYYKYNNKVEKITNLEISSNNLESAASFDVGVNSANIQLCAKVINGIDKKFEKCFGPFKRDDAIPSAPVIIASDGKNSDSWHNASSLTLSLNETDNKTYVSGSLVYYLDNNNATTKVSSVDVSNEETGNEVYRGKLCTQAGNCTESDDYVLKYDKTAPNIKKLVHNVSSYSTSNISYRGTFNDDLSGVVAWKLVNNSTYKDDSWDEVAVTTNDVTKTKDGNTSGTVYYLWVKDAAGNYSSRAVKTVSYSTGELSVSSITYTINSPKRPIDISTFTDNGEVIVSQNGNRLNVNINNGVSSQSSNISQQLSANPTSTNRISTTKQYCLSANYEDCTVNSKNGKCSKACPLGGTVGTCSSGITADANGKCCVADTTLSFLSTDEMDHIYTTDPLEKTSFPQEPREDKKEAYIQEMKDTQFSCTEDSEKAYYCTKWNNQIRFGCNESKRVTWIHGRNDHPCGIGYQKEWANRYYDYKYLVGYSIDDNDLANSPNYTFTSENGVTVQGASSCPNGYDMAASINGTVAPVIVPEGAPAVMRCNWVGDYACETGASVEYSCPSGYNLYNNQCYSCSNGYSFSNGSCTKTVPATVYKYNVLVTYSY